MNLQERIRRVNIVFVITVFLPAVVGLLPLGEFLKNRAVLLLYSQLILALPAMIYLWREKIPYVKAVRFKMLRPVTIILLILFSFLISPLMTLINAISMLFVDNTTASTMADLASQNSLFIAVLTTAIIPALFEESVYRGVFYNEYRKAKPLIAILLSAFLFAVLHGNFNQFSYALLMGIVFSFIIEATDSIFSSMIVHFIINAGSIFTIYLYPNMIAYLETVYRGAIEEGNHSLADMVLQIVGGTDFSMEGLLEQSQQTIHAMTFTDVIMTYGFSALICTTLAFFVFMLIAKRSGRWDFIKNLLSGKAKLETDTSETEQSIYVEEFTMNPGNICYASSKKESKGIRLITLPLAVVIVVCMISMVIAEFL